MLLQVEIATKSLLTNVTSVRLVIVVSVHVECEIVNLKKRDCKIVLRNCRNSFECLPKNNTNEGNMTDLVECLVTDVAFVSLLPRVRQTVVLVVSLLVEALATELTDPGLVAVVDPHVGVEGGAPVEGLPTGHALVGLLVSVDDLVSAQG